MVVHSVATPLAMTPLNTKRKPLGSLSRWVGLSCSFTCRNSPKADNSYPAFRLRMLYQKGQKRDQKRRADG